jgi:hypothetical protein
LHDYKVGSSHYRICPSFCSGTMTRTCGTAYFWSSAAFARTFNDRHGHHGRPVLSGHWPPDFGLGVSSCMIGLRPTTDAITRRSQSARFRTGLDYFAFSHSQPDLVLATGEVIAGALGDPLVPNGGAARYGRRFARSKRREGEALIREADNLACRSWNEKMWSDGDPHRTHRRR